MMGISEATFYRWKQLYGGPLPSEVKKLRQLEEENRPAADGRHRSDPRQGDAAGGDPPKVMTPTRGAQDDRLRTSVTIFFPEDPSAQRRRAWHQPEASSVRNSRSPAPSGVLPRKLQARRTRPSNCRSSPL
jgi:hypothetical protein